MRTGKSKGLGGLFRDALQGEMRRKYDSHSGQKTVEKNTQEKNTHGLTSRVRNSLEGAMSNDPVQFLGECLQQEINNHAGSVKECPLTRIDAEQAVAENPFEEMRRQVAGAMRQKYREPDQQVYYDRIPWWKRLFKL